MYSTFSENNIKNKVIEIIRTFRSINFLTTSDVKINELKEILNSYEISGEYIHKALYTNDTSEQGSFVIVLDKNLQPKNVRITQQRRQ